MTHATKAIYKLLLSDYVKVSKVSVEDMLYDENDIARSMEKIEVCYILLLCLLSCLALHCRKRSVA
jgi:Cft2 family RNA processing exonuclease